MFRQELKYDITDRMSTLNGSRIASMHGGAMLCKDDIAFSWEHANFDPNMKLCCLYYVDNISKLFSCG